MMLRILLLLGLSFSAYADSGRIGADFLEFYDKFMQEARAHNVEVVDNSLTIKFGKTPSKEEPKRQAYCSVGGGYPPVIVVDPDIWAQKTYMDHVVVIFHEMGHCLLHRPHRDDEATNDFELSLMHATQVPGERYQEYENYYNNELFAKDFKGVEPPTEWFIPYPKNCQTIGHPNR